MKVILIVLAIILFIIFAYSNDGETNSGPSNSGQPIDEMRPDQDWGSHYN